VSNCPKIMKVKRSQIGGKDGLYWSAPYDTIFLADDLDLEHEADVLEHEMAHARGDTLGEEPH
jgi:hypothetical protein